MDMSEFLPLRDVVFNTLRKAILTGELKPGERLMEIHHIVGGVDHTPGNVGAVVRGALQVCQQVQPGKAGVDGAVSLLQAQDMAGTQLFLQLVNHLLQRLHLGGGGQIVLKITCERQV